VRNNTTTPAILESPYGQAVLLFEKDVGRFFPRKGVRQL
jgi:hypothetical protein